MMNRRLSKQTKIYKGFQILLDVKVFSISGSNQGYYSDFGVFTDISNDGYKDDRLCLILRKNTDGLLKLTLVKIDHKGFRTELLEISMEDQSNIAFNSMSKNLKALEFTTVSQSLYEKIYEINGFNGNLKTEIAHEYTLMYDESLIELSIKIDKCESYMYNLITNSQGDIQQTFDDHFNGWFKHFGIFLNERIIDKSMKFIDCVERTPWTLYIAEKCHMIVRHGSDVTCVLPWNKDCLSLVRMLASYLNINFDGIRLFNEDGVMLHENKILDIDKFRPQLSLLATYIRIFYDINTTSMIIVSMQGSYDSYAIIIPEDCLISELKERLSLKLDIDKRRLILFRNDIVLPEDTMVSIEDKILYLVAAIPYGDIELDRQGSFGPIFKCSINSSETIVALKEFRFSTTYNTFIREFLLLRSLEPHPNIVQYLDIFVKDQYYFIGMEYLTRGSLYEYLKDCGPIKQADIRYFVYNILLGLKYLHDNKIIHRDIKAANVLLGDDNIAKLCGFGFSKILEQCNSKQLSAGVTLTDEFGSLRWMAPEVLNGDKYALKADIWSVGVTVIEMITGQIPYSDCETMAAFFKIGTTKRIEFTSPEPMSTELEQFVNSCLKPSALERPNVDELLLMDLMTHYT